MISIGIDLGGTTVKLGVVKDRGEIVYRNAQPSCHDPDAMVRLLCEMIEDARARYPGARVAISTAGTVDSEGNIVACQLGFDNAPIGPKLFARLGEQVPIQNDGLCALIAEHDAGALKDVGTGLLIRLGTGIGGGVIAAGRPYLGHQGIQTELGHMITHVGGERCACGQRGCWEQYASASALSRMAGGISPRAVIDGVREGAYGELWQEYLYEVAQGLIGLCSIFYPDVIAVGGGLSNAGDIVIDGIRSAFETDPGFRSYYSFVQIRPARFRNDAGIIGAAALAESS